MLLVASVYGNNERNKHWFALQQRFLHATTRQYDFAVYLNYANRAEFRDCLIIKQENYRTDPTSQHYRGLVEIINYFKDQRKWDHLLILDSDCFPVRNDWQSRLLAAMQGRHQTASLVRCENLDTFYHPAVVFFTFAGIQYPSLETVKNLRGDLFNDIHFALPTNFPLLRTNQRNWHPVLGAIYWYSFYHHGCGSRPNHMHMRTGDYYGWQTDELERLEDRQFRRLIANPDSYLRFLRGEEIFLS